MYHQINLHTPLQTSGMETGRLLFCASLIISFLLLITPTLIRGMEGTSIGVNYGTVADDLPLPAEVADFISKSTIINRIRLFDTNAEILQAFALTEIAITVTIPNDKIPHITNLSFAKQWLQENIRPYFPATKIIRIFVGNEVLSTANKLLIANLVPAMQTLYTALKEVSLDQKIQVSTPLSLGILSNSSPPSTGKFCQGYDNHVIKPLLSFLRATNSPFMINPYPFFGSSANTLDYALFRPNSGVFDENTQLVYTNMLDGQLDAVYTAMKLLGFEDVEIAIAETGWPSRGDSSQVGVDVQSAAEYNSKLIKHVTSQIGTPLMPNRTFETYIFALFNENLKPGPTCERNFGLFSPNMTPMYDIGIIQPMARSSIPMSPIPESSHPRPKEGSWCLPKQGAEVDDLQRNIDYVCDLRLDCGPIKKGGECFLPNTIRAHAAFAMNKYYQFSGRNDYYCDFQQTGVITKADPSYGNCKY